MPTRLALLLFAVLTAAAQSNPELAKLFADDQADRANQFTLTAEQQAAVFKKDIPRLKRVRELIAAGALKTSEDYVRAAYLYQHGLEPNDYMMAHVLGMVATKIDGSGAWISAASLDRYLLSLGKPQIFGLTLDDHNPFDRALLPDSLREALCAPSIANRTILMASIAKDPAHPVLNDPCMPDPAGILKAMSGKWMLTYKTRGGEFTHATLEFSLSRDGGIGLQISGPSYPKSSESEFNLAGIDKLQVKVKGDVFDLTIHGDVMTGRYTSGSYSAAVAGVR